MHRKLERRSLGLKLAIGFSLILLITLAVSIQGLLSERELVATLQRFHEEDIRALTLVKEARIEQTNIRLSIRQAVLARETAELSNALRLLSDSRSTLQEKAHEMHGALLRPELHPDLSLFDADQTLFQARLDEAVSLIGQNRQQEALQLMSNPTVSASGSGCLRL